MISIMSKVKSCSSKHIYNKVLYKVFIEALNAIVENKDYYRGKWREELKSENLLIRYKSRKFLKMIENFYLN